MLSSDKNIDSLQELLKEVLTYLRLRKRYVELDVTEKMAVLLSTLAVGAILLMVGMVVILLLSYLSVLLLGRWLGSEVTGCVVVCAGWVVVAAVVYAARRRLIVNPVARFVARLFVEHPKS